MSGAVCIDASVAVKWLFNEENSDRALALRSDVARAGGDLIAPPLLYAEVTSAVYKRYQRGEIILEDGAGALAMLATLPLSAVFPARLPERAFAIASRLASKWVYDAFYVALAEIVGCELWTADTQLHRAVRHRHPNVRLLSEYALSFTS